MNTRRRSNNRRDEYRARQEEAKQRFEEETPEQISQIKDIESSLSNNSEHNATSDFHELQKIYKSVIHNHNAVNGDSNLSLAEILNKGLTEGAPPFTEERLDTLRNTLYSKAITQQFSSLEGTPVIGGLKQLDNFARSTQPSDPNLRDLFFQNRQNGYADRVLYHTYGDHDPNLETALGITPEQFYTTVIAEQDVAIREMVSALEQNNFYKIEHASKYYHVNKLERLIEESAEAMNYIDPEISVEDHRQGILAKYELFDEKLAQLKNDGAVSDINRSLNRWNKTSFEYDNKAYFNMAAADNKQTYGYIKRIAEGIDLDIKMANEDSIVEAGVNFEALKEFNSRHTQLAESSDGGALKMISRALGAPSGCEGI
jgi:hypothetical protein